MHDDLNAQEAAEALGLHRNTVQAWLREGRIRGERRGREWAIPREEVERLQDERVRLKEAGQGIQAAGKLLRDLAWKRWQVAEQATARLARQVAETREQVQAAYEAGSEDAVELARGYHQRLDELAQQVDRLREANRVVETADDLHAEGIEKEREAGPVVFFPEGSTVLN